MDRLLLSQIDEELESSEVKELCFLCIDFVNRKHLEKIVDAKGLFLKLEEKGLLEKPSFLLQILKIIHRTDLTKKLESGNGQQEETDTSFIFPKFRILLYRIYEELTKENLDKMKFLLRDKLGKRHLELSSTALEVFAEMEKMDLISYTNVDKLLGILDSIDKQLSEMVENYKRDLLMPPLNSGEDQSQNTNGVQSTPSAGNGPFPFDENDFYAMTKNPRGLCVIINNETFRSHPHRTGSDVDAKALDSLFQKLGFSTHIQTNLTAEEVKAKMEEVAGFDFTNLDALVVCVLSHGSEGCIFASDDEKVKIIEMTEPFNSLKARSLQGKPKLFFIQACQIPNQEPVSDDVSNKVSHAKMIPQETDFLLGMSTLPGHKAFRHTVHGSLYMMELCNQLEYAAERSEHDDILTVLTRVNREVSQRSFNLKIQAKQIPEPKYTLTKRLVLRYV